MIQIAAGQTASMSMFIPFSGYGNTDSIDLLFYCASAISPTASLTVSFSDDSASSNIYSASGTIASGSLSTGSFYTTRLSFVGNPPDAFSYNIATCSVTLAGSGTLKLDHMKISTGEIKTTEDMLTSRITASGSTPIINKSYGQPMEIEYYIVVT